MRCEIHHCKKPARKMFKFRWLCWDHYNLALKEVKADFKHLHEIQKEQNDETK